ncbi:hypothetical protein BC826DRAFT_1118780 [Russula brevipes]|nr:hypothetical protein BC826DRAFT_1118780 [Russula brevipes]
MLQRVTVGQAVTGGQACGCKFASRKTARKHKCKDSKVVRIPEAAVGGQVSRPAHPPIKLGKPAAAPPPPSAPTDPVTAYFERNMAKASHSNTIPAVTGDSRGPIHVPVTKGRCASSPTLPPPPSVLDLKVQLIMRSYSGGKWTRPPSPNQTTLKKLQQEEE